MINLTWDADIDDVDIVWCADNNESYPYSQWLHAAKKFNPEMEVTTTLLFHNKTTGERICFQPALASYRLEPVKN